MNDLKKYNQKRNFNNTKEPIGKKRIIHKKLRFVVQHHLARKDHYDLRLEWNGVLKSWAVPKGPSYNVKDKRLAVQVEDHPYDYRKFEGVIPKGEYGGGPVMIWDEGYWEPLSEIDKSFSNKTIKFILKGKRLKGKWTLIPMDNNNWLIRKENDGILGFNDISEYNTSIKTGRTMEEIINSEDSNNNVIESVKITNPDKVILLKPKITKLDLVKYYEKVADRMMPLITNRLVSTIRCPDGYKGDKFFKKHLKTKHKGIGKVLLKSDKGNDDDYYYIKDASGLISEVQMNGFEFHIWGSSIPKLNSPNMMVFDLDPDEGLSLEKVRLGVKDLKSILDEFGLISFLKTSGGKGYHVVVPISTVKSWKKFREIAKNIAKYMEYKWPDRYVSNVRLKKRKNKIFIDWIRNTKGATSVAPYSVRIRKKATVSMPISWSELDKIKPDEITIEEAVRRLKRKDPWTSINTVIQ